MKYTFIIIFLLLTAIGTAQNISRYTNPVFDDYNIYVNIIYAESPPLPQEKQGQKRLYSLDFYEPADDYADKRPVILFFPDGDFVFGSKEQAEISNWCKTLTKFGFTCACISHRQGYDASRRDGVYQAIYRGVQDARAAARYLIENQQSFNINPDKIFLGGKRSGATIALYTAFLEDDELMRFAGSNNCLDCSGNPYKHDFKIAGIINFDGSVFNENIINRNSDISILNVHIEGEQTLDNRLNNQANTNFETDRKYSFSSEKLHQHFESLNIESSYVFIASNDTISQTAKFNNEIAAITGFLAKNLSFSSPLPIGKTVACSNSSSNFSVPLEDNCSYEWKVQNGTISFQDKNTIEVRWNAKVRQGAVSVIKTDATGAKGNESEALIVDVIPQPLVDSDIKYLSDNTIQITDKSMDASLLSVDYGYQGNMFQGQPQATASFTYDENGTYFLIQTVENRCGIATQSVPIDISTPLLYQNSNFKTILKSLPNVVQKGSDITVDIQPLKNIKELSVALINSNDEVLSQTSFNLNDNPASLTLPTSTLSAGTYFLQFSSNKVTLAAKKIKIK